MFNRFALFAFCVLSLLGLSISAFAQNPHFVGPISATDRGVQLTVSGSVAGLGFQNIDVVVRAEGIASIDCISPGGNVAPGQRTSVTTTATRQNLEVKNGRADFTVTTPTPVVSAAQACPNRRWTARVTDVVFTSFTIDVIQPSGSGNIVLSEMFLL